MLDLIGGGLGLLGGLVQSNAADRAADSSLEAARIAADAAAFKPYNVTTGFGTGYFDANKQTAGYRLDPALQAYRDQLLQMGAQSLPTSMTTSPQQAGLDYFNQLQQYKGLPSTMATQYSNLGSAAARNIPTNLANVFSGIQPSSYSNLAAQQASMFNRAGAQALNAPVANVANAYRGVSPSQFSNMAQGIASDYTRAGRAALGQDVPTASSLYSQIREMQRPEEERQQSALNRSLFSSGRGGLRTAEFGGTPEQLALSKAQEEARNQAAYQAINQADALSTSQQARAQQLTQMGMSAEQAANAVRSEQFGQRFQLAGANMGAQQAQQMMNFNQQNQAMALAQQGLSADQIANQLAAQRYNQQYQLAQGRLGAGQAQAGLAQGLSGLGMSANQLAMQQAATARAAGMSELDAALARGQGLFTSGFGVEQLGMTPLQMGAAYGGQAANTAGGQALLEGGLQAAQANLAGNLGWANTLKDIGIGLFGQQQ